MRLVLLFSVAVLLAACSDSKHTTAPPDAAATARTRASSDVVPDGRWSTIQGKPAGISSIIFVTSDQQLVPAGQGALLLANCPAGTMVISGGYRVHAYAQSAPPFFGESGPEGNNWAVSVDNSAGAGLSSVALEVFAFCAS